VITAFVVSKKKHRSTETKSDFVEPRLPFPNKQREHPVTQSFLPSATEMEACFISITLNCISWILKFKNMALIHSTWKKNPPAKHLFHTHFSIKKVLNWHWWFQEEMYPFWNPSLYSFSESLTTLLSVLYCNMLFISSFLL